MAKEISQEALDTFSNIVSQVMGEWCLERMIKEYGKKYEHDKDPLLLIRKLGEEFGELAEAMGREDRERILEEAADMGIILVAILGLYDASLTNEMYLKVKSLMLKKQKK